MFVCLQYLDKIGTNFFGVAQSATAKSGNVLGMNLCLFCVLCISLGMCMCVSNIYSVNSKKFILL